MLTPIFELTFKKEAKRAEKRGQDLSILKYIIDLLIDGKPLPAKHRNHKLHGKFDGYWECHITPNWLLIYKKSKTEVIFARSGSHSDLFG